MALNGVLAGLVGITAGADSVTIPSAMIIGLIAGTIVVFSIVLLDKMGIDDPVGAISVHGVVGIWGTLAVGIPFFQLEGTEVSFMTQLIGTLSISAFAFGFSQSYSQSSRQLWVYEFLKKLRLRVLMLQNMELLLMHRVLQ